MERMLAMIVPLGGGDQIGGGPVIPPTFPSHPISGLPGIDNGLPTPPPGVWPPPSPAHPIVPAPPGTPPGVIWPPVGRPPSWGGGWGSGDRPDNSLPGSGGRPDNSLPGAPVRPDNSLPTTPPPAGTKPPPPSPDNSLPSGGVSTVFWIVAGIPGVGWRYVTVDISQRPDNSLPPAPVTPGNELPPTEPAPKV